MNDPFSVKTIDEVSRFFRVNRRTVSEWLGRGCPGVRGDYPLADILHWLRANVWSRDRLDHDPELSGGDSPALERYREERALLARMERLERERSLVSATVVSEQLGRLASLLRNAGDILQRDFGPDAHSVLDEALVEFERAVVEEFSGDSSTVANLS